MAFGKEWVDNCLEDGDEHHSEDGAEGLHLVGLDGHFTQPPVHPYSLQRPARALRRRGKGETRKEHSGVPLMTSTCSALTAIMQLGGTCLLSGLITLL